MLKTGIVTVADLAKPRSIWGRRRWVSLDLLTVTAPESPVADDLFHDVMLTFRLSNGTYRTTNRYRFSNFDPLVNETVARLFPGRPALSVHDWATSDGSAALEWARSLRAVATAVTFCASDRALAAVKACPSNSCECYFFEPGGDPIQYTRPPFVISLQEPESVIYPVNRLLATWAHHHVNALSRIVRTLCWSSVLDATVFRDGRWRFSQVPLVHPAVTEFTAQNPWFQVKVHSIFEPLPEAADVIRSMNILNKRYFDRDQLVLGIRAAYASLRPAGLWVVGRSGEGAGATVDADLFQKTSDRFCVVATAGNGSEIRDLVTEERFT